MARILGTQHEPTYAAAACLVEHALRNPGSLFSPDRPVWRPEVLAGLHERHATAVDAPGDAFDVRWARRLDGAPPEIVQLAAELCYAHLLFAADLSGKTKRRLVAETLARDGGIDPLALPETLGEALEGGVATTGVAFKLRRMSQLGLLITAAAQWWQLAAQDREKALGDPWAFKTWLHGVPHDGAQAQREALLHLVHPAAFEPIVSAGVKQRIVHALSRHVPAGADDVDAALAGIRAALERRYGRGFQFIDPEIAVLWQT